MLLEGPTPFPKRYQQIESGERTDLNIDKRHDSESLQSFKNHLLFFVEDTFLIETRDFFGQETKHGKTYNLCWEASDQTSLK